MRAISFQKKFWNAARFYMTEATDPRAWVEHAEEDFVLARAALRRKQPLASGACFHAQQCAENHMKALLISKGADFPKTHDLLFRLIRDTTKTDGIAPSVFLSLPSCFFHKAVLPAGRF
jgi:hypothetical protein